MKPCDWKDNCDKPLEADTDYVLRKYIGGDFYWYAIFPVPDWKKDWGEAFVFKGRELMAGWAERWSSESVIVRLTNIERCEAVY